GVRQRPLHGPPLRDAPLGGGAPGCALRAPHGGGLPGQEPAAHLRGARLLGRLRQRPLLPDRRAGGGLQPRRGALRREVPRLAPPRITPSPVTPVTFHSPRWIGGDEGLGSAPVLHKG